MVISDATSPLLDTSNSHQGQLGISSSMVAGKDSLNLGAVPSMLYTTTSEALNSEFSDYDSLMKAYPSIDSASISKTTHFRLPFMPQERHRAEVEEEREESVREVNLSQIQAQPVLDRIDPSHIEASSVLPQYEEELLEDDVEEEESESEATSIYDFEEPSTGKRRSLEVNSTNVLNYFKQDQLSIMEALVLSTAFYFMQQKSTPLLGNGIGETSSSVSSRMSNVLFVSSDVDGFIENHFDAVIAQLSGASFKNRAVILFEFERMHKDSQLLILSIQSSLKSLWYKGILEVEDEMSVVQEFYVRNEVAVYLYEQQRKLSLDNNGETSGDGKDDEIIIKPWIKKLRTARTTDPPLSEKRYELRERENHMDYKHIAVYSPKITSEPVKRRRRTLSRNAVKETTIPVETLSKNERVISAKEIHRKVVHMPSKVVQIPRKVISASGRSTRKRGSPRTNYSNMEVGFSADFSPPPTSPIIETPSIASSDRVQPSIILEEGDQVFSTLLNEQRAMNTRLFDELTRLKSLYSQKLSSLNQVVQHSSHEAQEARFHQATLMKDLEAVRLGHHQDTQNLKDLVEYYKQLLIKQENSLFNERHISTERIEEYHAAMNTLKNQVSLLETELNKRHTEIANLESEHERTKSLVINTIRTQQANWLNLLSAYDENYAEFRGQLEGFFKSFISNVTKTLSVDTV